jgi:hypothetical protein
MTAGSSVEVPVATTKATVVLGTLEFDFPELDSLYTNTVFRVHVDGTDSWTGADAYVSIRVKARVGLGASATRITAGKTVTLTASVYPKSAAGGTAVFERLSGKKWVKITSKTLAVSGSYARASYKWKPGRGTQKVRVRYLGGAKNAANTSSTKTITVR